jgi:sorting nexin-27
LCFIYNLLVRLIYYILLERKIQPNEVAHQLYVQNYRTASASCLCIKRWLFNPAIEIRLIESDNLAATFIFWSTIDEVDRNHIIVGDRLYELKALQDSSKKLDVIILLIFYFILSINAR